MLQQESESNLELLSHMSQLLLGHLNLVIKTVDTEETDPLLDQFRNLHELVTGSLRVQFLGHHHVVEDVGLLLEVELFV